MPSPPIIMSHAEWMRRTDVKKTLSSASKDRSDALKLVDAYLQSYDQQAKPDTLEALGHFLDAWHGSKMKTPIGRRTARLSTIRDHDSAVTDLKRQVDLARTLRQPLEWNPAYPGIYIGDDVYRGISWVPDDFVGAIRQGLQDIASRAVGQALLENISDACVKDKTKKVVIEYTGVFSSAAPLENITPETRKKVQRTTQYVDAFNPDDLLTNPKLLATPTDTIVGFRRTYIGGAGAGCVVMLKHTDTGQDGRPMHIGLAHELVHAYHYVNGLCYRAAVGGLQDMGNTGIMEEEMRTVGLLAYEDESPSENAIRDEWGIPRRRSYTDTIGMANVVATPFDI